VDFLYTAFRFVVDKSKAIYSTVSICREFVVESATNPQHPDMSKCCGIVVDLSKSCGFLWICCTTCYTANPQLIEKVEFKLIGYGQFYWRRSIERTETAIPSFNTKWRDRGRPVRILV
jgi:hypothetical protein